MGRLTSKGNEQPIAYFRIKVNRCVNVHVISDTEEKTTTTVEFSLNFMEGGESKRFAIPVSELDDVNWSQLDYRARISPGVSPAKAKRFLADYIRSKLPTTPVSDVYRLSHAGSYKVKGIPVFCVGNEVLFPSSQAKHELEFDCQAAQRLDFDGNLSEQEAASEMLNLICLSPGPGRIILSYCLSEIMRQAYTDAGKAPSFCVYLYGRSGTQKTTLATYLTQMYNRSGGIASATRLNASNSAAAQILTDSFDQVVVLDDLCPAVSNNVRKRQEETLIEITRYIGDGTVPLRVSGNKLRGGQPNCGVLFTGEYLIGGGSDAARLLPVEMEKPDTNALKHFLERPLIVSTFYRYFISWYIENYEDIASTLKEWLDAYRITNLGVHDRLRETHYFLNTAYVLLLQYCGEKSVLSAKEIEMLHSGFLELLSELVRKQNDRVKGSTPEPPVSGSALEHIRDLYKSNQLSIVKNAKYFDDAQHDGVLHNKSLCLRQKCLTRIFPESSIGEIEEDLKSKDALDQGKSTATKQIHATKGKRFYCIPLSKL